MCKMRIYSDAEWQIRRVKCFQGKTEDQFRPLAPKKQANCSEHDAILSTALGGQDRAIPEVSRLDNPDQNRPEF